MNTITDGVPEPVPDLIAARELPLPGDSPTDEERAYSVLADLCDAAADLVDEHALAVAEAFNMVAELIQPERVVTQKTATLRELFTEAREVLTQLSAGADTTHVAFRYATANLQLQAVAQRLGLGLDRQPHRPKS